MRIGVLSDTHGDLHAALAAIANMGQVAMLLHAGDHYRDARELARRVAVPIHMVVGNCDSPTSGPSELVVAVERARILLTHGHTYRVKQQLDLLMARARALSVNAVVFGHTHLAEESRDGGILLLNPGCLSLTRSRDGRRTYAIIDVDGSECRANIRELP